MQQGACFVRLDRKRTETYDDQTVFSEEQYTYDEITGHVVEIISSGTGAERLIKTHAFVNLGAWQWRLVRETLTGEASGQVRMTAMAYEPGTGNMIEKESWLSGGDNPRVETTYDEFGNPVAVTDPLGQVSTTAYDAETNTYPVEVRLPATDGVEHLQQSRYDLRFGKATGVRDENGHWTHTRCDAFGRPLQTDYPDGGQTRITYHDEVFPRHVTVAVKETASGNWIENYQYVDGFGRSIQRIGFGEGGKAIVTRFYYDRMGRNDRSVGPFFSNAVGFPIDPTGDCPWQETEFDQRGRPARIKHPDDDHGIVAAVFSYSGLAVTATDPDGGANTEYKDYLGRVIRVTEHGEFRDFDTAYEYNAAGDLVRVTDAAGNLTTIDYDTLGRKVGMHDPDMNPILKKSYRYSPAGDITAIDEFQKGERITYAYGYDRQHRLVSETHTGSKDGFPPTEVVPQYDGTAPVHAPKQVRYNGNVYGLSYDANGNLVEGPDFADRSKVLTRIIRYNTDNLPVQISYADTGTDAQDENASDPNANQTGTASNAGAGGGCWINSLQAMTPTRPSLNFHYDGVGVRVIKQVQGGRSVHYVGAHFEVQAGVEIKYIFAGNLRIAKVSALGSHFFHKDHLGSSQAMTDLPGGEVTETAGYLPFGVVREHSGTVISYYSFTDQELDAQSGLYNFDARLYDPVLAIFITPDSIVADPFDPQSLNRYSYCRNNPLVYVDPSGHVFVVDDLIIGAVIGAMIGAVSAGMNGQNPLMGMAIGAATGLITAGVFDIAGGLIADFGINNTLAQAGIHAAAGAVSGGVNSTITGGDIGKGMLTGAAAAGFGKFTGGFLPADSAAQFVGRTLISGVIGGATSEVYGGDFGQGFAFGAATAAFGYGYNDRGEHSFYKKFKSIILGSSRAVARTFGYGMSVEEFKAARARTRQYIEMLDVATQGLGQVTVAFDVGGALATQWDIFEANVPMGTKIEATVWNGVGVLGIIGMFPTPQSTAAGFGIDAFVFFKINNLLKP